MDLRLLQTGIVDWPDSAFCLLSDDYFIVALLFFFFPLSHSTLVNSINHEYKEWNEKNPQLLTCNKDTKNLLPGSTVPQEVDTDKEVVFTYDVSFVVCPI